MKYSIEVETGLGELVSFPHYGSTERVLAMRIARDQSRHSPACTVYDMEDLGKPRVEPKTLVTYVDGKVTGTPDPVVWDDDRYLWDDDRNRLALLPDPDESWEGMFRE